MSVLFRSRSRYEPPIAAQGYTGAEWRKERALSSRNAAFRDKSGFSAGSNLEVEIPSRCFGMRNLYARISHSESSVPLIGDVAMQQGKMLGMKRAQLLALLVVMMLEMAATTSLPAERNAANALGAGLSSEDDSAATQSEQTTNVNSTEARDARLAWFKQAKYGMFIHWGSYAIPAGEWNGQLPRARRVDHEPVKIPVKQYEQLAKQFNPVDFDADQWVQLARMRA